MDYETVDDDTVDVPVPPAPTSKDNATPPPPPAAPRVEPSMRQALRFQARPHYMLGGLLLASTAAQAATQLTGSAATTAFAVAVIATVVTLVSAMTLKRRRRVPRRKMWAWLCAAGACVWLTVTAATGVTWDAVAVLTAIGYGLALPFWRDHRIPNTRPLPENPTPLAVPSKYVRLWASHVGAKSGGVLPGSYLIPQGRTRTRERFTIQFVPGRHVLSSAVASLSLIAGGLHLAHDQIIIEGHESRDASKAMLTIVTSSPIEKTVHYPGPSFDASAGLVHLGPFADGEGLAPWRVYADHGVFGGFLVGDSGMGKSRAIDNIAASVSADGRTVVWYADPQEGASSTGLATFADWTARGVDEIQMMLEAAVKIMTFRQRENIVDGLEGFTPSIERPGLLVIVDECHDAFALPEIQAMGADVARKGRKTGIGLIAASQVVTLDAWGGAGGPADVLRSQVLRGNALVFHTSSNNTKNVMPGLGGIDPRDLPLVPGFAYTVGKTQGARTAPLRTYYMTDAAKVFAGITPVSLDPGSAAAAGRAYLGRHEREAAARSELEAYVAAMRDGRIPAASNAPDGRSTRRTVGRGNLAVVLPFAPLTPGYAADHSATHPAEEPSSDLRPAAQRIFALTSDGVTTPAELREATGWGETHVRNLLNDLVSQGLLSQIKRGVYEPARRSA